MTVTYLLIIWLASGHPEFVREFKDLQTCETFLSELEHHATEEDALGGVCAIKAVKSDA